MRVFSISMILVVSMLLCVSCKRENAMTNLESLKGKWICNDLKDLERYENFSGLMLVFGDNNEVSSFLIDKKNNLIEDGPKTKYFIKNNKISLAGEKGSFFNYNLSKDKLVLEAEDENAKIRLVFIRRK